MRRALAAAVLLAGACSVGSGDGELHGAIYLPTCGFPGGADPETEGSIFSPGVDSYLGETLDDRIIIRLQRGTAGVAVSDGLVIDILDRHDVVRAIRESPDGVAVVRILPSIDPVPPDWTEPLGRASLYFNRSCPDAFADFSHGEGMIRFTSMYAREDDGDPVDADTIAGSFEGLRFIDDRVEAQLGGVAPWAVVSGWFEFDYKRGRPAQPFP